jgi:RNA polymerase sigma-70 factor (ECF subfamily)
MQNLPPDPVNPSSDLPAATTLIDCSSSRRTGLDWLAEHGDALYAYAITRVANPQIAEELVQETFLGAIKNAHQFTGDSSPQTWLIGILRNKLVDHYRRKLRQPQIANVSQSNRTADSIESQPSSRCRRSDDWSDPCNNVQETELQTLLQQCIEKLPDLIRQAFEFRFVDEMEHEEVCKLQAISRNNLAARMYRARTFLRECLNRHWR